MDLGLNESQTMLQNFAREFLEKECPEKLVRDMEEDEKGYSPELWKKMGEQGWQGLIIPDQYGGAGMNLVDLAVLLQEFGRFLVPGPFIPTVTAGVAIEAAGTEQQKQYSLPKIATGEMIMTVALTEPSARWDADGIETTYKKEGDTYRLSGTKLFVQDAHVATQLIVAARQPGTKGEQGVSLFLVDAKGQGVAHTLLKTIASDKQTETVLDNAQGWLLGETEGNGWQTLEKVRQYATVMECAYMVGLAQMDFEISVNYAKERVQFGRPIGSFQAIQHKCADMVTDVDGARFMMYKAAWSVAEGEPDADLAVSMAKAWCGDATRRVVAHGQQIHGGIGFTKEYKIQLYFRRQKRADIFWGDPDWHRERVANYLAAG